MKRILNRIGLILCLASLGMLVSCMAVEACGYLLPFESYISFFSGYALIFYAIYRFTRPATLPRSVEVDGGAPLHRE